MRGVHGLLAILAFGLALSAPARAMDADAAPRKNRSPATPELSRLLRAADQVAGRGDDAMAALALEGVAAHPDFTRLPASARGAVLLRAARHAADAGDAAHAQRLAREATAADPGLFDAWYLLAHVAAYEGAHGEAAAAFARALRLKAGALAFTDPDVLAQVVARGELASPAHRELLEALHAQDWMPHGLPADDAWARLALARLAAGDAAGAREALEGLDSPSAAVWIATDRRFDGLLPADDPRRDPARSAEAHIARVRAIADAAPDRLLPRVELAGLLLSVGREDEARALADAAIAAPGRFADAEWLHWAHNVRAIALRREGRLEEAVQALADGVAAGERGQPNVSQALNRGTLLVDLERPEEALASAGRLQGLSGYGEMVQSLVRMRAYRQLGRQRDAEVWFDRLREHRDDGRLAWLQALLWWGAEDEAAAWLAGLLADPSHRADALHWCQDWRAPEPLPGRVPLVEARRALLARADVRAAIDAVGRIIQPGIHDRTGVD